MSILHNTLLSFVCCLAFDIMAAECGDNLPANGKQILKNPDYTVAFVPSVWPIPVGQHFNVVLQVCSASGKPIPSQLRIDAEMPAHRHGMNYRPTVKDLKEGKYQADGLMFHMPGRWRFNLQLGEGSQAIKLNRDLEIP